MDDVAHTVHCRVDRLGITQVDGPEVDARQGPDAVGMLIPERIDDANLLACFGQQLDET